MSEYKDVDRIGNFRARIIEFGLKKASESESVAVALTVHLTEMWDADTETWQKWDVYMMTAIGDMWIIKKDGTLNNRACESLVRCAGWDGTLESIAEKTWEPVDCQVKIGTDTYKGTTRFRIDFLNSFDSIPGKFEELAADKVQNLSQRFGSAIRAIAGTARANSTPAPNGKPAKPKKAPAPPAPAPVAEHAGVAPLDGDTPF